MNIHIKDFRVRESDEVDLKKRPTIIDPIYKSKEQYAELLAEHVAKLSALQQLHYASARHAVLLIFQAMNAAGKDGAIRHVTSGVNPISLSTIIAVAPGSGQHRDPRREQSAQIGMIT